MTKFDIQSCSNRVCIYCCPCMHAFHIILLFIVCIYNSYSKLTYITLYCHHESKKYIHVPHVLMADCAY